MYFFHQLSVTGVQNSVWTVWTVENHEGCGRNYLCFLSLYFLFDACSRLWGGAVITKVTPAMGLVQTSITSMLRWFDNQIRQISLFLLFSWYYSFAVAQIWFFPPYIRLPTMTFPLFNLPFQILKLPYFPNRLKQKTLSRWPPFSVSSSPSPPSFSSQYFLLMAFDLIRVNIDQMKMLREQTRHPIPSIQSCHYSDIHIR